MSYAEKDKASRLEDCGQSGVCELSPGCVRHFIERNAELVKERDEARAELEHAYRENGALYEAKIAQAEAEKERDLARELLANVFDRYACAACSHGKTGPECPCGFHAAGAYLDRTEKP